MQHIWGVFSGLWGDTVMGGSWALLHGSAAQQACRVTRQKKPASLAMWPKGHGDCCVRRRLGYNTWGPRCPLLGRWAWKWGSRCLSWTSEEVGESNPDREGCVLGRRVDMGKSGAWGGYLRLINPGGVITGRWWSKQLPPLFIQHSSIFPLAPRWSLALHFFTFKYNCLRFVCSFFFKRATGSAYKSSQAAGAGLRHSHSNTRSKPRLPPTPWLRATQDP